MTTKEKRAVVKAPLIDRVFPSSLTPAQEAHIRRLNEEGTEEERQAYLHARRKDRLFNTSVLAGAVALAMGAGQALRSLGITHSTQPKSPIEQDVSSHPGSESGAPPSTVAAEKITADNNIQIKK